MLKCFEKINWAKTGIFAAGVLFGTAGIKALSSDDAKKVYTGCTAAFLRAKDCVMKTAATVQRMREISTQKQNSRMKNAAAAEAEVVEDVEEEAEADTTEE